MYVCKTRSLLSITALVNLIDVTALRTLTLHALLQASQKTHWPVTLLCPIHSWGSEAGEGEHAIQSLCLASGTGGTWSHKGHWENFTGFVPPHIPTSPYASRKPDMEEYQQTLFQGRYKTHCRHTASHGIPSKPHLSDLARKVVSTILSSPRAGWNPWGSSNGKREPSSCPPFVVTLCFIVGLWAGQLSEPLGNQGNRTLLSIWPEAGTKVPTHH